jgi:hypothetical protein
MYYGKSGLNTHFQTSVLPRVDGKKDHVINATHALLPLVIPSCQQSSILHANPFEDGMKIVPVGARACHDLL